MPSLSPPPPSSSPMEVPLWSMTSSRDSSAAAAAQMIEEQLVAMLRTERAYRVEDIPCTAHSMRGEEASMGRLPHDEWRRKICEWCYKVVDHFRIDREVVGVSLNFFDRYLVLHSRTVQDNDNPLSLPTACRCPSCQRAVDSRTFQLAAMTSLYLAIKVHAEPGEGMEDGRPRRKKLRLLSFVDLSRGQFSAEDICAMERNMLETLQWRVHPPTPMSVVSYLLRLFPHKSCIPYHSRYHYDLVLHVLHELSRYLSELSVCLAHVSSVSYPSQVAFASILVSMDMLTLEGLPEKVRSDFCEVASQAAPSPGAILLRSDPTILYLMGRLQHCFSPGMLLDDCHVVHPISIAREAGLLDLCRMDTVPFRKHGRKTSHTSVLDKDEIDDDEDMSEDPVCLTP